MTSSTRQPKSSVAACIPAKTERTAAFSSERVSYYVKPSMHNDLCRASLGDDAATPHFIETVHGRGYRFIAQVTTTSASCRKFRLRYVNASNMLLV